MLKKIIVLLRITLGWLFFYAGITKIINPMWSAKGYLMNAETFNGLYTWLAQPNILPITNFLSEWGLTLIGVSLILGIFVRFSSIGGAILMILFYFPALSFPYAGEHSYIIDEHVIYALLLLFFAVIKAGRTLGIDAKLIEKYPTFPRWLS